MKFLQGPVDPRYISSIKRSRFTDSMEVAFETRGYVEIFYPQRNSKQIVVGSNLVVYCTASFGAVGRVHDG